MLSACVLVTVFKIDKLAIRVSSCIAKGAFFRKVYVIIICAFLLLIAYILEYLHLIAKMGCWGECLELGPPPNSILNLPPPPIPAFIQHSIPDLLLNTTPCFSVQQCESSVPSNHVPDVGDYIEMPHKDVESWSVTSLDDTWLLVLVASSIGVLLLGALLAMFLLKCREMSMFHPSDCSLHTRDHRQIKALEHRDCTTLASLPHAKLVHPTETVLYQHAAALPDNRMVWAALTPRGTQHFISEAYPRSPGPDDHYETVEACRAPRPTFDNSGFVDYECAEGNADMRCAGLGLGSLRRGLARPSVSSPTRIEHPNLPPLNLHPHKGTLKRGHRGVEAGTLPKYAC